MVDSLFSRLGWFKNVLHKNSTITFWTRIGIVTLCAIEVSESLELKRVWRKKKSRKRGGQYPKFFEDVWEAVGKVISLESS